MPDKNTALGVAGGLDALLVIHATNTDLLCLLLGVVLTIVWAASRAEGR